MVRPLGRPLARKAVTLEDLREDFLAHCEARNLSQRTLEWYGDRTRRFGGSSGTRGYAAFGLAYGLAPLGCALPVFLALLGTPVAAGGPGSAVVAFALYGIGMATTLDVPPSGLAS